MWGDKRICRAVGALPIRRKVVSRERCGIGNVNVPRRRRQEKEVVWQARRQGCGAALIVTADSDARRNVFRDSGWDSRRGIRGHFLS
jgi:hypothetical protein